MGRIIIIGLILLGAILIGIEQFTDIDTKVPIEVNPLATQTVAGMKKLQTMMEIYMTENGSYPPIGESCEKGEVLSEYLVPSYLSFYPVSLRDKMQASVSEDGYQYVLQTKLSATSKTLLSSDEDGIVLGCDCNDPNFCFVEHREDPERLRELYGEEF